MWLPEEESGSGTWRGAIRDVARERTFYVVGSREIADYIGAALESPPERPKTD
jgi:hypothetical protein